MIHTFIIDKKIYHLKEGVKNPSDCSICYAYISQEGDIFGDLYFHSFAKYDLDKLHKLLSDKKKEGCDVLLIQYFQDVRIRPLDIVRWIEDPTWVGMVEEGDENHASSSFVSLILFSKSSFVETMELECKFFFRTMQVYRYF